MPSTRVLYGTTAFLSAFLLFVIEPMSAKQILPLLGGSSAVWLTCLVFFQAALLLGYLYAHWLTHRGGRQFRIHMATVAVAVVILALSMLLASGTANTSHPVVTIFWTLTRSIGLPFLVLASTSPLLQRWLSERESTGREAAPVWYRLFALSNAGSLLALIAFPTLIEPHITLRMQRGLWAAGFVLFVALVFAITAGGRSTDGTTAIPDASTLEEEGAASPAHHRWLWFLLPMAAAMQLSAVTAHLTVNIAAIPLLWVLPLAVYLLTFIIAFDRPVLYQRPLVVRLLVLMLASLGYALSKDDFSLPIGLTIAFFLFECFVACLFCHGEAYRLRPRRSSEATLFYLLIAAGGAAGTFMIGIAFPLIFSANYDLALAFFATAVLALAATWNDGWAQRLLWSTAAVLMLALAVVLHLGFRQQTIAQVRNFYGTLRVKQADFHPLHVPYRTLMHGTIQHGTQIFSSEGAHIPTTYYAKDSGIGLALRFCCDTSYGMPSPRHIGVIGLGTGTVAAYTHPLDRIRFYEINPQVEPIARHLFSYLSNSPAKVTIVPGDARTSLSHEPSQQFDVLALDAFSGDAIPLHLLTIEAMQLYRSHLKPNGILVVHVSNQYLNLAPEVALLGEAAHLEVRDVNSPSNDERGEFRAEWVVMTADKSFFSRPEVSPYTEFIVQKDKLRVWTDDYSSLLPIVRLSAR
ncbi:MAG: fused MFS/spermidine synthase [Edaphobacter sp.]|uniref:fused MFS/spermidine synthase n=1 Tax=Edaphobacter sp. TaxID=1934404 RepID=UPI002396A319|nr:fused MFS/spermidine synthase [Edaphobacter sp.]MDE1178024.1 fused MFS/spermidine synthase [Edaphobacter sp.]